MGGPCIKARLRKDLCLAVKIWRLCKCGTYNSQYQVQFQGLRLYTLQIKFQFNQQNTLFIDNNFKQEYVLIIEDLVITDTVN